MDLQAEVSRRFSVEVHDNTIGRWLRQLGLTRLQPRPCHPRKIAEAEEAFKAEGWERMRLPHRECHPYMSV